MPLTTGAIPRLEAVVDPHARNEQIIATLASVIESRKRVPGDHARRVADRAMTVLRAIAPGPADPDLWLGFLLHDVGLIHVPEELLLRAGPLEAGEVALMRAHPQSGYEMLRALGLSGGALDVVRSHHERFDGKGYPRMLAGDQIPLPARVFAVVDAYDSMTHARPYRRAMDHDCATAELRRQAGVQFDPDCVEALVRMSRTLARI